MKTGLVLEGGGMRGMFTAGVLDVFMKNGISLEATVGVSAGAAFGCNYKSRQIGRAIRYNLRYAGDPRFCSISSLIRTGDLFGADFCYHELPERLDIFDTETYQKNPMAFYAVATDLALGKPVYHRCDKADYTDLEWLRASASMPLVSRVVEIDGRMLLDGGISDSIPLRFLEKKGYEKNVVVLTQPRDYRKEENKALPLLKLALRRFPRAIDAMRVRHEVYNRQVRYVRLREQKGAAFVIAPPEALTLSRTERDRGELMKAYRIGVREAKRALPALRAFLENENG